MTASPRPHGRSRRRRLTVGLAAVALVTALTGCTGGYFGPVTADDSGSSSDRRAGAITRGTAVCILNGSSDTLRVSITGSDDNQDGYRNTSGTEDFSPRSWRCMKSDAYIARDTATTRITIASGEEFRVQGFNPPFDPPWIAVNGDARTPGIGSTTDFKIGKHPISAERVDDTGSFVRFDLRIS